MCAKDHGRTEHGRAQVDSRRRLRACQNRTRCRRFQDPHGAMAEEVERFAQRLRKQIGVPVEMVDERLTSWEAERLLEELQGRLIHEEKLTGSKKPKNVQAKMSVDAVAAAVILKEYLDRQAHTAGKA